MHHAAWRSAVLEAERQHTCLIFPQDRLLLYVDQPSTEGSPKAFCQHALEESVLCALQNEHSSLIGEHQGTTAVHKVAA